MTQVYTLVCADCGASVNRMTSGHPNDLDRSCPQCGGRLALDGA